MFKVLQRDYTPAEFKRVVYRVEVDSSVSPEDMLAPECWAHVAKGTKVGGIIEVFPRNAEWFLELMVRGKTDTGLRVAIMRCLDFKPTTTETETPKEFEVKFRGRAKWSVLRKSDRTVVFEGGDTKEDADKFVAEQELALA